MKLISEKIISLKKKKKTKAKDMVTRNIFENTEPECLILNLKHILIFLVFSIFC